MSHKARRTGNSRLCDPRNPLSPADVNIGYFFAVGLFVYYVLFESNGWCLRERKLYESAIIMLKTENNKTSVVLIAIIALVFCNSSIVMAKSKPITRRSLSSRSMRSMARAYMAYGYYSKAQPIAERALKLAIETNAANEELAMCLSDLSTVYTKQGMLKEAEEKCGLALRLQEKMYDGAHPYIAYTQRSLSIVYRLQGRYQNAEDTLNRAISMMSEYHQENDRVLAPFYVDLAKVFAAKSDTVRADSYFSKALDMAVSHYGKDHLYSANIMADAAGFYTSNGQYTKAEPLAINAQRVQEKIYGTKHHLVVDTWLTMASICQAKGQNRQAEKLINRATAAVEKTGNIIKLAKLSQQIAEARNIKSLAMAN